MSDEKKHIFDNPKNVKRITVLLFAPTWLQSAPGGQLQQHQHAKRYRVGDEPQRSERRLELVLVVLALLMLLGL